jgi:hypothetical protein
MTGRFLAAVLLLGSGMAPAMAAAQDAGQPSECVGCHQDLPEPRLSGPAKALESHDVHAERGFGCIDCHGGDPAARDAVTAKAPTTGFRGVPSGEAQIETCAACHSDAAIMRRFAPSQRIDQALEYASSDHGIRLAAGDGRVATCASCHGAHGIRAATDPASPVYVTNVASTCGSCHADAAHMTRPNGTSLPTAQRADYEESVHHQALTVQRDLSAPTCNDCHGNHGAAPPGVDAATNVCGTCHAVYAENLTKSTHQDFFDGGCVECHGNHAIARPSDALLIPGADSPCSVCHDGADDPGVAGAAKMHADITRLTRAMAMTSDAINRLKRAGMEMGDQELVIGEAQSHVVKARTDMHTFNPAVVEAVVEEGLQALGAVDQAADRARSELSYRRLGLAISLAVILLMVMALFLKIRQLDRRHEI